MKRSLHGGNIHAAARALGIGTSKVLDLSASINPLGMPSSVQSAIQNSLKSAVHYPDPDAVELTAALAAYHSIAADTILCGNGSTELIYLIARALQPEQVLIPSPTFAEYERAIVASRNSESRIQNPGKLQKQKPLKTSEKRGLHYFHLKEKDGFILNADAFIAAMTKMLLPYSSPITHHPSRPFAFLCNPNNPTGVLTQREDVLKIAHVAQKLRCYLVVDEAFIDFRPEHSVIDATARNPYLIVLRSMTKFYALAGIRLGYGVFSPAVMRRIQEIREPWTVSTIAQVAGLAALQDAAYRAKTMKTLGLEKRFLEKSFRRLGIDYLPSAANYYLLKMHGAVATIDTLAAKGILLRSCANFRGLSRLHMRIAVRSRHENTRFLKELNACRP